MQKANLGGVLGAVMLALVFVGWGASPLIGAPSQAQPPQQKVSWSPVDLETASVGVNPGYTAVDCSGVTTCSATIKVAASSDLLIGIGPHYNGHPFSAAVHGYTASQLTYGNGDLGADTAGEGIWGVEGMSVGTVTVYVNSSGPNHYLVLLADFTGAVISGTYDSGTGNDNSSASSSTAAYCTGTTTQANEVVFSETYIVGSTATISVNGSMTPLSYFTDPTASYAAEDQFENVAAAGKYNSTSTISSAVEWGTVCIGLLPLTKLAAPTGLSVTADTTSSATLAWTNPAGTLVNDTLYYSATCSSPWSGQSTNGVASTATVSGLSAGTNYCFYVTAWNSNGQGAPSGTLTVVPVTQSNSSTSVPTWAWGVISVLVVLTLVFLATTILARRKPPPPPPAQSWTPGGTAGTQPGGEPPPPPPPS
ncbi:MAG: fibronectin type III domain-containing protein [Thermoplasmata archaeon]